MACTGGCSVGLGAQPGHRSLSPGWKGLSWKQTLLEGSSGGRTLPASMMPRCFLVLSNRTPRLLALRSGSAPRGIPAGTRRLRSRAPSGRCPRTPAAPGGRRRVRAPASRRSQPGRTRGRARGRQRRCRGGAGGAGGGDGIRRRPAERRPCRAAPCRAGPGRAGCAVAAEPSGAERAALTAARGKQAAPPPAPAAPAWAGPGSGAGARGCPAP